MVAARVKPELEAASIVMRGNFNPSIFQPAWLAAHDLIAAEDAEKSEVDVISTQVTAFRVNWLELQITDDRFQATTADPSHYPSLSELVRGVFSLLEFTPVHLMGINRQMHIRVRNEDEWHRLGDSWAPKEPWQGALSGKRPCGLPGVRSLTMEGVRQGSTSEFVRVTVEPSAKVKPGIYVYYNEHYEQAKEKPVGELMHILDVAWAEAPDFALRVADHLLRESV